MKDSILRKILFGRYENMSEPQRSQKIVYYKKDADDIDRHLEYAGEDGIILALIKRIEKLEQKHGK